MDHDAAEGSPFPVRDKPAGRPRGWFAACVCDWTGPERDAQAPTIRDLFDHITTRETA